MSQKILPYKIPKMMLTYPYNAFYFGILEANNIDYTDIILNDFLELYYFKKSTSFFYIIKNRFKILKLMYFKPALIKYLF